MLTIHTLLAVKQNFRQMYSNHLSQVHRSALLTKISRSLYFNFFPDSQNMPRGVSLHMHSYVCVLLSVHAHTCAWNKQETTILLKKISPKHVRNVGMSHAGIVRGSVFSSNYSCVCDLFHALWHDIGTQMP